MGWWRGGSRRWVEGPTGMLLGILLLIACLYSLLARDTYGGDFRAYYVASQAAHAGLDPYLNQVNVDERFADRDWLEVNSRFIYPPSSLLLFEPVSRLPYRVAKVVWGTGMALVMVWILLALNDRMRGVGWVAMGLFLSLPMVANIDNGQVDVLMLGLTLVCVLSRRRWLGAVCLGIAIAIKLSPVLVVLWLLARRRWTQAAGALAVGGALLALGQVVYGRGGEFLAHLRTHLAPGSAMLTHTFTTGQVIFGRFVVMGTNTYSLHYVYGTRQNPLRLLGPGAIMGGALLVLGYAVWVAWRREIAEDASFFGFLAVALFANLFLWPAGLVACFPLTLWIVSRAARPVGWGLGMLAPFFLPVELVGAGRFVIWCAVVVAWVWWEGRAEILGDAAAVQPQESGLLGR